MIFLRRTVSTCLLAAVIGHNSSIADADTQVKATQDTQSANQQDREVKALRIEPKFDDPNKVFQIDLGELICGSVLNAEVTVVNMSDEPIELPRRTFSCGCISGMPEVLSIRAKGEAVIPVRIEIAKHVEESFQNVAYWLPNGEPAIQLQFRYQSVLPVKFDKEVIQVDYEDDQIVRVKFEPRSPSVDLSKIQIEAHAPELKSASVDRATNELVFAISPSNNLPYGLNSVVQLSLSTGESGSLLSSLRIEYPHRTIVTPKELTFVKTDTGLESVVVIHSKALAFQLAANEAFTAVSHTGAAHRSRLITFSCKILSQRDSITQVELSSSVTDSKFDSVELRCGSWKHQVTTRINE